MENIINIDGLNIQYDETGNPSGPPVILLHGWGCNHTTVGSIAKCLEESMRVISLDLPGHGKSQEPDTVWGTDDFADLVVKLSEKLRLKKPSLIGHSFGGRTSIALASKMEGDEINKIVLVDSAGITPKRSISYYYKVYSYKILKKFFILLLGEKVGNKYIEKALKKRGSSDYKNSSPKMRAVMSKCVNEDLRNRFKDIKNPVLLIWGEKDTATPLEDAKIMEKNIPDAGLVVFPDCGHYCFLENPFGFKTVIREFFKEELS